MKATERWVENRPARRGWPELDLHEAWAYREVGLILAQRNIKVRYKQTFFGISWVVLQPLLAMVLFTLVLGQIPEVSNVGVPYSAFLIVGLAVWYPFSSAIASAAESLVSAPELVTKVYLPRVLAPLSAVLATVVDLAIALALAEVVALVAGVPIRPAVVLAPFCAVFVFAAALGIGLWLAALNVLYRDVRHAVPFLTQLLFFASPILYMPEVIDRRLQWIIALNPVSAPANLERWALLGTDLPAGDVLISLSTTLVLVVSGLGFFRWTERRFADRI